MAKVLPLEAFTLGIQMLPCMHNLYYLMVLQGSKSTLVGWVLVCNCFWLCLNSWRLWVCTVFTQGKWQPWLFNGSSGSCEVSRRFSGRIIQRLPGTAELERVGYVPPRHVVPWTLWRAVEWHKMFCWVYRSFGNDQPLEKKETQLYSLLSKMEWSREAFALHSKPLVHAQDFSVLMSLPTLILLPCSQFKQRK